jgi:hypothetical protein
MSSALFSSSIWPIWRQLRGGEHQVERRAGITVAQGHLVCRFLGVNRDELLFPSPLARYFCLQKRGAKVKFWLHFNG